MGNSDKNMPSGEGFNTVFAFLQKNIRFIAAGVLLLLLVVLLANCAGKSDTEKDNVGTEVTETMDTESEAMESYQIDAYQPINELMNHYYTAYAAGDLESLMLFAMPVSESEKSYIQVFSQYVEEYRNLKCYTKSGLEEGSYLVTAYTEVKFKDVDTVAPNLELFYVRTYENGSLYIDNVYGTYNDRSKEFETDQEVAALIHTFDMGEDVVALHQEVVDQYNKALESDEALNTLLSSTILTAMAEWRDANPIQTATEEPETQQEEPQEPQEEEPEQEQNEAPTENKTVYAKEGVRVRAEASTDAEVLGLLEMGAAVTMTGTNGEWTIVEFDGKTGYVKSEFLSESAGSENQTASNEGTSSGSLAEGKVVTVSGAVNIRASMSETAEKIGTAFDGEKVTVVMSYAEGWTKVNWNGKTGYIKTDLLK